MPSEVVMTCIGKGRMLIGRLGRCICCIRGAERYMLKNKKSWQKAWLRPNIRIEIGETVNFIRSCLLSCQTRDLTFIGTKVNDTELLSRLTERGW